MTRISINTLLQEYADIPQVLEASGITIGECLGDMVEQYPQARTWLFDPDSLIRVMITINNLEMVTLDNEGLNRKLAPDDEIVIFALVSGG